MMKRLYVIHKKVVELFCTRTDQHWETICSICSRCTTPSLIKRLHDGDIKVSRLSIHPLRDLTSQAVTYANNSLQISFS